MNNDARWAKILLEESPEIAAILDVNGTVLRCSRRARVEGIEPGQPLPARVAAMERTEIPYELDQGPETIVYLGPPGALGAYQELRSGFTAAVSHELRTPLARLMIHLDSAELAGADVPVLLERARAEVDQVRELIDEVLFLSQLESGQEIVDLGRAPTLPILNEVRDDLGARAERAGIGIDVSGDPVVELPLRARMQKVIAENLVENSIRYAGEGATIRLAVTQTPDLMVLEASDDGIGVSQTDIPRLFERFFRADRARSSRGTGLGLSIVKHIVVAAGGLVDAAGGEGRGLKITCSFPNDPVRADR